MQVTRPGFGNCGGSLVTGDTTFPHKITHWITLAAFWNECSIQSDFIWHKRYDYEKQGYEYSCANFEGSKCILRKMRGKQDKFRKKKLFFNKQRIK